MGAVFIIVTLPIEAVLFNQWDHIEKNTKNWYTIDALGATFAIFGNFDNLDTLDPIYKLQDLKITLGS